MWVKVLGSAAGGGFPQWNCGCPNCVGVRRGEIAARPRSQESLAVSADRDSWFVLNASPDIARQIESFDRLQPRSLRDSPIAGILLSNGDLDHCLGVLSLRESYPLALYATERVQRGFSEQNRLFHTLERFPGHVTWHQLQLGEELALGLPTGQESGLTVRALAVPGNAPLHLRELGSEPEDNVGLVIRDARRAKLLAYLPAVAAITPAVQALAREVDALFFDGTFWASDELIALGIGERRAEDMAHCPIGGKMGSLSFLAQLTGVRRFFIHINNTNPILREDSAERALVRDAGVEVADDGLELEL